MADKISIDLGEYNKAVKVISEGRKRMDNAYSKLKLDWGSTSLSSFDEYAATLENIKLYLEKYAGLLKQDEERLTEIGKTISKADGK